MSAKNLQAQVCLRTNRVWEPGEVVALGASMDLSKSESLRAMSDCTSIRAFYGKPRKPGQFPPVMYYKSLIPKGIYTPVYYDNSKFLHWMAKWFTFSIGVITITSSVVSWAYNFLSSLFAG